MTLRPIYYDTETTGIRFEKDRIIEIAAYDPIENREFCEFINPGLPIPPQATAIHNITDEMVADAPDFGDIARALESQLNVPHFDIRKLEQDGELEAVLTVPAIPTVPAGPTRSPSRLKGP